MPVSGTGGSRRGPPSRPTTTPLGPGARRREGPPKSRPSPVLLGLPSGRNLVLGCACRAVAHDRVDSARPEKARCGPERHNGPERPTGGWADVHVVVVGCGRVGSGLATTLEGEGHSVAVIDKQ